jgi:YHS domain-containing protein
MSARDIGVSVFLTAAIVAPVGTSLGQQRSNPPTTAAAEVTTCAQAQMIVDQLLATAMTRVDAARQTNAAADLRVAAESLQATIRDARAQLAPCATSSEPTMDHSKMPMGTAMAGKPASPVTPPAAPMDHPKMPIGAAPAAKPGSAAQPPAPPMNHSKMPMGAPPAAKTGGAAKPAAAAASKPAASAAAMDHSKMAMGQPADATSQAVDPVCGLKVDPASAPHTSHDGRTYSFCSEKHRQLFQKTPAKYLPKGR